MLREINELYGNTDCRDLGSRQLEELRDGLKNVSPEEIKSSSDGLMYIKLLHMFRSAVAENDKFHGENYPSLLNSLLSVGEDGLYSNNLRFIFELIQNVDDCDYPNSENCRLDMQFRFDEDEIILTYNEVGFTPFNVFAITGIAEAAKNVSSSKNEIGEKGIGFKSVFGVADKVLIRSGWFSFILNKENFTVPISAYSSSSDPYIEGTKMTLYVPGKAKLIYSQIKNQYCKKEAIFSRNPLLFLNKLTSLNIFFDEWRRMEFHVSKKAHMAEGGIHREDNIQVFVDLHDYDNGRDTNVTESFMCTRYTLPVTYSRQACQARYGENTKVGENGGKRMLLQAVLPTPEHVADVGNGSLYSFLPTQLKLTVPIVIHVPFKLDASREFVDPQNHNRWFLESSQKLSELMEYLYKDWCKTVRRDIVFYIPGARESLFAPNNGKEKCLSENKAFQGIHFLELPIFITTDDEYRPHQDVFSFNPDENVMEPERVYRMLMVKENLFLAPETVNPRKYDIKIYKDAARELLQKAISNPNVTEEALKYLDNVSYFYGPKDIPDNKQISLTCRQIEIIMQHEQLAKVFTEVTCRLLKLRKSIQVSIADLKSVPIHETVQAGFDKSETPKQVERYLDKVNLQSVCLDIKDNQYLPCSNGLVLSKANPTSSLASLCFAVDEKDTFAIRIKLKEASERLNQFIEDDAGSAEDYLRELRNIRLTVRDSLGNEGYKSYINLILRSGTERKRFIQELIQNADDCVYDKDIIPSFYLQQDGSKVVTQYNEEGFTRENIRSITAIGESTKNRLLKGEYQTIGEKGVGFKTVFAVASQINIFSGEYNFSLTDEAPTIPKIYKRSDHSRIDGTRMEIFLKGNRNIIDFNEKNILELCLCLRQLKEITIGPHKINISDTDDTRTLVIDGRKQVYRKFVHKFEISDPEAIKERARGMHVVLPQQQIICYVPERLGSQEYHIYSGLPTRHMVKIPVAIDAPFELTTSREQIEEDCEAWNGRVRLEMYKALRELILFLRNEHRVDILRFTRYVPRLKGKIREYVNDIFDSPYLTSYNFLEILKNTEILPTYNHDIFATSNSGRALRFPEVAHFLFKQNCFGEIDPSSVLDINSKDYDAAINALDCKTALFEQVFPLLMRYSDNNVHNKDYRTLLYEYLQDSPDEYADQIKRLAIIPVYGNVPDTTRFVKWQPDKIFVKNNANKSTDDYFILNTNELSKAFCERMLNVNINEMNDEWERRKYDEKFRAILDWEDIEDVYNMLLFEFNYGNVRRNYPSGLPMDYKERIPLKNRNGVIACQHLFLCQEEAEYFPVDIVKQITAADECARMAESIGSTDLCDVHYEDFKYDKQLDEDDIEVLLDDYFKNSDEILRGFYQDGLLPDELLDEYNLNYLANSRVDDTMDDEAFPDDPVYNREQLQKHLTKKISSLVKIIPVTVERTVYRGKDRNGNVFDLQSRDTREGALHIYASSKKHGICFCQMCKKRKPSSFIEVNNLQILPKYYFPQMRVSLCLECSKIFEGLRKNDSVREEYYNSIKDQKIGTEGNICIPIGNDETLTFTAKHLAEIQEILKRYGSDI